MRRAAGQHTYPRYEVSQHDQLSSGVPGMLADCSPMQLCPVLRKQGSPWLTAEEVNLYSSSVPCGVHPQASSPLRCTPESSIAHHIAAGMMAPCRVLGFSC